MSFLKPKEIKSKINSYLAQKQNEKKMIY